MIKIPIVPIDLRKQKNYRDVDMYIELHPTHLYYHAAFVSDEVEDDKDSDSEIDWIWREDEKSYMRIHIARTAITKVRILRNYKNYGVEVVAMDGKQLDVYYTKKKEADELFETLQAWIIGTLSLTTYEELMELAKKKFH